MCITNDIVFQLIRWIRCNGNLFIKYYYIKYDTIYIIIYFARTTSKTLNLI